MKKSLVLAALAGIAFATVAHAGPDPMQRTPVVIDRSAVRHVGDAAPSGGFGSRDVARVVYNNIPGVDDPADDGILFYDGGGISDAMDDLSLATGGLSYPLNVSSITIGLNSDGSVPDFRAYLIFWDSFDNSGTAGVPYASTLVDGFYAEITGLDVGAFEFTFDLSANPIAFNDGGVGLELAFTDLEGNVLPSGPFGPLYWTSHNTTTSADTQKVGHSDSLFALDVDENGEISANEASYYYGLEFKTRFYVSLTATTACPGSADFNGDGFVDFFDFDDFVSAFEGGC